MKKYFLILIPILLIVFILGFYVYWFYIDLGFVLSDKVENWAHFGGYFGGVVGPILSFFSLVLLIWSLRVQFEESERLKSEIKDRKFKEYENDFNDVFFRVIESQRNQVDFFVYEYEYTSLKGSLAVNKLEESIREMMENNASPEMISDFIDIFDMDDRVFDIIRSFYISIKLISETFRDDLGFGSDFRRSKMIILINFIPFSQFKLILILLQFKDYHSVKYLKETEDFVFVLNELNVYDFDSDPFAYI